MEADAPRQRNGHDCGLYVLAMAEALAAAASAGRPPAAAAAAGAFDHITLQYVADLRRQLAELVARLAEASGRSLPKPSDCT